MLTRSKEYPEKNAQIQVTEDQYENLDSISHIAHLLALCLPRADTDAVSITTEQPSPIQVLLAPAWKKMITLRCDAYTCTSSTWKTERQG